MGLEQAIQNLADAINDYTKVYAGSGVSGTEIIYRTAAEVIAERQRGSTAAESSSVTAEDRGVEMATEKHRSKLDEEIAEEVKAKAAAEKKLAKAKAEAEAKKAAAAEAAKTPEPEVILAGEKTEAEVRDEAFNIDNGYCTRPFLDLGKNGGRDQQAAVLKEFGVARLSLVETDKIPALREAILNAVAVASTKKSA
jgi:hypothetical protein